MNERILELAEQADDYTDNKIQQQGEYHPDWHDIRDQRFAELIVAECTDMLMQRHEESKHSHNYYHVTANMLKKHFGVEK